MKLRDVQSTVKAVLAAHPALAGIPIVLDDGTGEANQERLTALKIRGLCLLIWRVESGGLVSTSRTGALVHALALYVFIEENVSVSREQGALQFEDLTEHVMEALSGARVGPERLTLDDPPFDNLGKVNGVNRVLVSALAGLTTQPTP